MILRMRNYPCWWRLVWGSCAGPVHAADPMPKSRDVLVYKDGDRVQGKLVRHEGR